MSRNPTDEEVLQWEDKGGGAHGASPFAEPTDNDSEHSSSDESTGVINAEPAAAAVVMKAAAAMGMNFVNQHDFYQLPACLKRNESDPFVTSPIGFDKEFKEPAALANANSPQWSTLYLPWWQEA